jgi:hypothetical protein
MTQRREYLAFWRSGILLFTAYCLLPTADAAAPAVAGEFERIVIDDNFPGGYQVEVADVNGDKRPDIIGVGGGTCAWYENPTWKKHVVTTSEHTPGIISSATADLDGDGKAEIAIAYEFAMNEPTRGKLLLAVQGSTGTWERRAIADVGSIHRLRWGDVDGDGRLELVVAPIFGPNAKGPKFDQDDAQITVFWPGNEPKSGSWTSRLVALRPVLHAIEVIAPEKGDRAQIFTADNVGTSRVHLDAGVKDFKVEPLTPGAPGPAPKRGSSEVHIGRLGGGHRFIATIDPWHGQEVAVCVRNDNGRYGSRTVIDNTLADGHALWVADVDGDGDDEIFAGHRGRDHRVSVYDFDGESWKRKVLDSGIAAQDLRGGDLDSDGMPDVVAIGGQTHNVIWYRPASCGRGNVR